MTQGKWTSTKVEELDSYKFESDNDCLKVYDEEHDELIIAGGEIVQISSWSHSGSGTQKKGNSEFESICRDTMRIICKSKPEELKNIYNLLTDRAMKSYCKELQKEIILELQEEVKKLQKTINELEF